MFSTTLITVLFLLSAGIGSAEIIYVEPGNSIQAAVNNSTTGDFVIVKAGEYEENIVVNVSGLTISSESGSPDGVLVRGREKNSSIFEVKADNVTISGFNITGLEEVFSVPETSGSANSSYSGSSDAERGQTSGSGSDRLISQWDGVGCPSAGICLEQVNNCTIEKNVFSKIGTAFICRIPGTAHS